MGGSVCDPVRSTTTKPNTDHEPLPYCRSELAQLMEGTTAGALIPEIVRRGFQDLLEAGVTAAVGAQIHQRCPDERATHRNGYRERLLTTQVGDLTLAIPRLRKGSFFPNWLKPRRRLDKALYAVVMEAYTGGIATRKIDALVEALGGAGQAASPRQG